VGPARSKALAEADVVYKILTWKMVNQVQKRIAFNRFCYWDHAWIGFFILAGPQDSGRMLSLFKLIFVQRRFTTGKIYKKHWHEKTFIIDWLTLTIKKSKFSWHVVRDPMIANINSGTSDSLKPQVVVKLEIKMFVCGWLMEIHTPAQTSTQPRKVLVQFRPWTWGAWNPKNWKKTFLKSVYKTKDVHQVTNGEVWTLTRPPGPYRPPSLGVL